MSKQSVDSSFPDLLKYCIPRVQRDDGVSLYCPCWDPSSDVVSERKRLEVDISVDKASIECIIDLIPSMPKIDVPIHQAEIERLKERIDINRNRLQELEEENDDLMDEYYAAHGVY